MSDAALTSFGGLIGLASLSPGSSGQGNQLLLEHAALGSAPSLSRALAALRRQPAVPSLSQINEMLRQQMQRDGQSISQVQRELRARGICLATGEVCALL